MNDLTAEQLRIVSEPDHQRSDATAFIRRHARDEADASLLLAALGLTDPGVEEPAAGGA